MAEFILSARFKAGAKAVLQSSNTIGFSGGRWVESCPALFDKDYNYVTPANLWLIYLLDEKKCKDISSYLRAILAYWRFIEDNNLAWDKFPSGNMNKPTYRFRNEYLIKKVRDGDISASTANSYICHVVNFYKWLLHEDIIRVSHPKQAPFKIEYVSIKNGSMLGHTNKFIRVDTTDLRIRVPRKTTDQKLNPLTEDELKILGKELFRESIEFQLIVHLQIRCGLRLSEACSLSPSQLSIPYPDQVIFDVRIGPGMGTNTKYDKLRTINIDASLMRRLYQYKISDRRQSRLKKFNNKNEAPLFISQRGTVFRPSNMEVQWGKMRERIRNKYDSGFNHKTHDNRATYGTYLLASLLELDCVSTSEAMQNVMLRMGHAQERTTWEYLSWIKEREVRQQMICLLDKIMEEAWRDHDE